VTEAVRRILVVEDEMLVAFLIEDYLTELGHSVVGPVSRLDAALHAARTESFDCAILDINLSGKQSFPVAQLLAERGIPFIFASGYGQAGLTPEFIERPVLQKPFTRDCLRDVLASV
jgi:DNA-binding response OmpR family regulator